MSRTNLINNLVNLIKATKNIITGKLLTPLGSYYDPRYPPTKFLKWSSPKINIPCIMSGYPRSGTHWIRNVIERSSGAKTFEISARKITPATKAICILKIHARNKWMARAKALWLLPPHNFGGKYIYVYRDPRDAIISLYEMYRKVKDSPDLEPKDFMKLYDPIRQYQWEINAWVLEKHKDVLLVRFEDLKMRPLATFEKIFDYLDIDAPVDCESIGEKVLASDSENRPRATAYGWKKADPKYQCIIDSVNKELDKEIKLLGYEDV
jgi:hypothetical protein